jgi:hypothetical protein
MKMKNPHCRNISKIQQKILERVKVYIAYTHIHDHSLAWLGTYTSVNGGGVKSVLLAQA